MNQSLFSLYQRGMITLNDALERSHNLDELMGMLKATGQVIDRKVIQATTPQ